MTSVSYNPTINKHYRNNDVVANVRTSALPVKRGISHRRPWHRTHIVRHPSGSAAHVLPGCGSLECLLPDLLVWAGGQAMICNAIADNIYHFQPHPSAGEFSSPPLGGHRNGLPRPFQIQFSSRHSTPPASQTAASSFLCASLSQVERWL